MGTGTGRAGAAMPRVTTPRVVGPARRRCLAGWAMVRSVDPLGQLAEEPIFLVGHPRSGTTWVYDILTAHPQVTGVLESWIFTPSLGIARLFRPEQWQPEELGRQREVHGGRPIGLSQMVTRDELAAEVRQFTGRLMARALRPEHRFLVEKTPTPYTDVGVVREVFPGARFVHVLRDGRDVAVSLAAAARAWNPGWRMFAGGRGLARYRGLLNAARSWQATVHATQEVGRHLGDRYLEVRYENLRATPYRSIQALFDFCGVPSSEDEVQRIAAVTDFGRHADVGEDRFRRRGEVGGWRERFNRVDAAVFEAGSRGGLAAAGYERGRGWWATSGFRRSPKGSARRGRASPRDPRVPPPGRLRKTGT